ncbi:MAG TPA: carbohydrate kinase, partial [Mycobacteriales bacterium]|nr:carbohydrate kinase [Mycobacteriales bacterium]
SVGLTAREREIVELLRRDPLIGSEAIAQQLGTSRASVNVHLSNLGKKGVVLGRGYILGERPGAVVIGGANVDVKARSNGRATPATSNPGTASMTPGGVGRNIAENLARLGVRTFLVSAIGRDALGDNLLTQTVAAGVRCDYVQRNAVSTGTYTAVLDCDGELVVAVSDMAAVAAIGPSQVNEARDVIAAAGLLIVDGNLGLPALTHASDLAAATQVRTILEPVSAPKAGLIASCISADRPFYAVTPNRDELAALTDLPTRTDNQLQKAAKSLHRRGVEHVWVRLGARGSLFSTASAGAEWLPAGPSTVTDVTGAGDAMLAAFCYGVLNDRDPIDAARFGQAAAELTLASPHTVRPDLTPRLVESALTPPR